MKITITSRPNNLFHRGERVDVFTDDGGSYEDAVKHIEHLIACEHDFECKVTTPRRELVDATLEAVSVAGVIPLNAKVYHADESPKDQ